MHRDHTAQPSLLSLIPLLLLPAAAMIYITISILWLPIGKASKPELFDQEYSLLNIQNELLAP